MQNPYVIISVVDGLNIMTIYEVHIIQKKVFYPYKSQKPTYLQYLKKNIQKNKVTFVATSFQKRFRVIITVL